MQYLLSKHNKDDVLNALQIYARDDAKDLINEIYHPSESALLDKLKLHPGYSNELPFYRNNNKLTGTGLCAELKKNNMSYDAIFYDCGEISSTAEWLISCDLIAPGGYAIFHDIYYPKSIKNIFVCALIELSNKWKIIYTDKVSSQGALIAQKIIH